MMEHDNYLGIDPTKLTEEELYNEITDLTDFELGIECKSELMERNLERAVSACLTVLNYNENDRRYGDKFYQASMLFSLFNYSQDDAIDYLMKNYETLENYVFAEALSNITYVEEGEFQEVRNLLKRYINEKGTDYFKELKQIESTKDVIQNFLESFE